LTLEHFTFLDPLPIVTLKEDVEANYLPQLTFAVSDQSKPAISIAGTGAGRRSRCESFAELIAAKVEVGLSAQRIYQDLVEEKGFQRFLSIGTAFCSQAQSGAAAAGLAHGSSAWRGSAGRL
jgi:hypothetical protein